MRDLIRSLTPNFLLDLYRKRKKKQVNKDLQQQKDSGSVITVESLVKDLHTAGISKGDTILVHSSMSKLGYLENGPKTFVDALTQVVGEEGNILMPTSPNASMQLDYIQSIDAFNVLETPSALGAITEYFRKLPGVLRSENATEPVSCWGKDKVYLTEGHFGELTPYTSSSPFARIGEMNGKILYVGVTLDNAGTNLHTLEDAVDDFVYPVYYPQEFEVKIVRANGERTKVKTKVHNPEQSVKRKCDGLIPLFEQKGVLNKVKIGNANTLLVDAKAMLSLMIKEYQNNGVTMYTPNGIENWKK